MNEIDLDRIDITLPPPPQDREPERQYYFMAKCRRYVEETEQELGRRLTFCIHTFGCQMNARDSEKLEAVLLQIGYVPGDGPEADFVLYNTCTVRENANLKVYGRLGYLKNVKKKNPHMRIAMCGCMMQEPSVVEKIRKSYPFVDMIFGTHNVYKLAEIFYMHLQSGRMEADIWQEAGGVVENLPSSRKYHFKAGVNIMYGCDNFCSYCIVPYVRGRERSRRQEEILQEIRQLAEDGVVEVMLLGQNVNSYGKNMDGGGDTGVRNFAKLLQEVEKIDGIRRIRFMTSHPKDLSDELIDVMAESSKICSHLHLPLQSGSTKILKSMNRRYTKEDYLKLVERIRSRMPQIALTTDLIVGFPGETEEDFQETLDVVRRVRYDSVYSFIYSKRTGTPAAAMEDQVPEDQIKDRFQRLLSTIQDISGEITDCQVGREEDVLMEEINDHDPSLITGRLSSNAVVHCKGTPDLIGSIRRVRLTESRGFYFMGELVSH